jgi:hypothetical protein
VVSPKIVQMKEPGQGEDEEQKRDDRREDLKRDRARVRQQVMLLKAVQQRPGKLGRPRSELQAAERSGGTAGWTRGGDPSPLRHPSTLPPRALVAAVPRSNPDSAQVLLPDGSTSTS